MYQEGWMSLQNVVDIFIEVNCSDSIFFTLDLESV